jgi:hypothetical protein
MMYQWVAYFSNGSAVKQFEPDGEVLFSSIIERQDELTDFFVLDEKKNKYIAVNLGRGFFSINGLPLFFEGVSDKETKYRLIYFRRNKFTIGDSNNASTQHVQHCLGFQTLIDGKSVKKILAINDETGDLEFLEY